MTKEKLKGFNQVEEEDALNALISIRGFQAFEDSEEDSIEFATDGAFVKEGDHFLISYDESEMTGMEGTKTTVKVEEKRVTISRVGTVSSEMVFEKGQKCMSYYETPAGGLVVGIMTKSMNAVLDESGGTIEIFYAVEIDHFIAGEHSFALNVKTLAKRV